MMPPARPGMPGRMPGGPGAIGAQPGPGASPMVAPGGGAGNIAGASALVGKVINVLKTVLMAFPPESKEAKAIFSAYGTLNPAFGSEKVGEGGAAGARQFMQQGTVPSQLTGTPSPGIMSAPLPQRPPMGPPDMAGGSPGTPD